MALLTPLTGGRVVEVDVPALEPFWRSASAVRSATRGAGVGLSLIKEFRRAAESPRRALPVMMGA